ncbi:MAG: cobalt ECF transporter T component CbiQ [Syntrophobacteraceae bacterium]|jgi:cobalt/nickel transport system permease protein
MQRAFELFSDIFAVRDNLLTRIDPRVKVMVTCLIILSVILSTKPALPLAVFTLSLVGTRIIQVPIRLVLARLAAPVAIVLVLVMMQAFLIGSTPLFTFSLLKWKISGFQEGAYRGILIGCRVLGAVSVILLMSFATQAHRIFHTLRWLGMPKGWVEVAMLMYRYIFTLLDQATDIMSAQRLRLGYSTLKRSLSSIGVLAGTVMILSMDQAVRTYDAMVLRGYKGYVPFGSLPAMSGKDRWILVLVPGIVLVAYLMCEWGL